MFTIDLMLLGSCSFVAGVGILGLWLRKHPSKVNAEVSSRIVHFLFFAGFGVPLLTSVFYPGLTRLGQLVGLEPLPLKPFFLIVGMLLGIPSLYFLGISNKLLRSLGSGANAFRRTLLIGATAFVSSALLTVYIWVTTAQIIAPPGLRILDFLWRVFSWLRA